jgi:hypothetical protein
MSNTRATAFLRTGVLAIVAVLAVAAESRAGLVVALKNETDTSLKVIWDWTENKVNPDKSMVAGLAKWAVTLSIDFDNVKKEWDFGVEAQHIIAVPGHLKEDAKGAPLNTTYILADATFGAPALVKSDTVRHLPIHFDSYVFTVNRNKVLGNTIILTGSHIPEPSGLTLASVSLGFSLGFWRWSRRPGRLAAWVRSHTLCS